MQATRFETYLDDLLSRTGIIPRAPSLENNRLDVLFDGKDAQSLLSALEKHSDVDGGWTVADFLLSKLVEGRISMDMHQEIARRVLGLISGGITNETLLNRLVDIYMLTEPSLTIRKGFVSEFIASEHKYLSIQSLLFSVYDKRNDYVDEFPELLFQTLNTDKGIHVGLSWLPHIFEALATSPKLDLFIERMVWEWSRRAIWEFVNLGTESNHAFFEHLPDTTQTKELILWLMRRLMVPEQRTGYPPFLSPDAFRIEEFQESSLNYIDCAGESVFELLKDFLSTHPWELYSHLAKYIKPQEVSGLLGALGGFSQYLFWIRDLIEGGDRADKLVVLAAFDALPWFQDEWGRVSAARKAEDEKREKAKEEKEQGVRNNISSIISNTPSGVFHPRLIELFDAHSDLFLPNQVENVKEHLLTFFSFELFPIEKIIITKHVAPDGRKSHSGGVWHMQWFFCLALRTAQKTLGMDVTKIVHHSDLIRAAPLNYLDQKDSEILFGAIWELSDNDAKDFLSVYDGSRSDDLAWFWGGQNFFPFVDRFKSDFLRSDNVEHLRRALRWWAKNEDDWTWWEGARALNMLTSEWIFDMTVEIPFLKEIFDDGRPLASLTPEHILGEKWNVCLTANEALVLAWDEDAITWRFRQLICQIAVWDPLDRQSGPYAYSISEIESEILHDGAFIKRLVGIDVGRYLDHVLGAINHALTLLDDDRSSCVPYARYLLGWMFEILQRYDGDLVTLIGRIDELFSEHGEFARFTWWFSFREFQWAKIKSLSPEAKDRVALSLLEDIRILKSALQIETGKKSDGSKVKLLVEWVSDRVHIMSAWEVYRHRYPWIAFEVINQRSAPEIKYALQNWSIDDDEIFIGLLDFDKEGFCDAFLSLKKVDVQRTDILNACACISGIQPNARGIPRSNVHALLIPVTSEELLDLQVYDARTLGKIHRDPRRPFFNSKPYFVIEHLFYGVNEGMDAAFFKEVAHLADCTKTMIWLSEVEIWDNSDSRKGPFARNLKKRAREEFWVDAKDLYKNFLPIFDKMKSIIMPNDE